MSWCTRGLAQRWGGTLEVVVGSGSSTIHFAVGLFFIMVIVPLLLGVLAYDIVTRIEFLRAHLSSG